MVQKNMQCSTKWYKLTEGDRKQMQYHQKFCGSFLYKILTSTDQEESKANQCKNIVHCQLGYAHILSRHHVSSHQTASRKHHMAQPSLQRNQKFTLHVLSHTAFTTIVFPTLLILFFLLLSSKLSFSQYV